MKTRLLATASVMLALGLACPAAAGAAEKAIWGPLTLPDGRSAFDTYRALGTDTFQYQLRWSDVAATPPADPTNPADPAYRWPAAIDKAIAEGRRTRVGVALLVTRTPAWANGGRSSIWAPSDPRQFGDFLQAASRRYPSVRKWMIWGEPNRSDRFQPGGAAAPGAYAATLDGAYTGLKRASARNIVIGGMTWTGGQIMPAPFLKAMVLPGGRRPRLDWFGHNPFPFRFPDLDEVPLAGGWRDLSDLDTFTKEVRRAYGRTKPLWLSEFTVLNDKRSNAFELFVSQQQQARWLKSAFDIADSLPEVMGIGWLNLVDQPPANRSSNWGLMTSAGAPKPAFGAYKAARNARLRPAVRAARRARVTALRGRGLGIRVRPKRGGRVTVELRDMRGRRMARTTRRFSARRLGVPRLRRRARLRAGTYELAVRAPGGETVRRELKVRK